MQTRSYDDKDGKKVYATEVVADDVILLGGRGEGSAGYEGGARAAGARGGGGPSGAKAGGGGADEDAYGGLGVTDDDVPF